MKTKQAPTVLVVEPRAADLEHTRALLMEAGFRVVGLSRFDAAVPLFQVLKPDAAVLALQGADSPAIQVARRLAQLSHGTAPLVYLVDVGDSEAHRLSLERGGGVDRVARDLSGAELGLRLHAQLRLRDAVEKRVRGVDETLARSLRDPLTGAYTRAYLLATMGQEMRRAERHGGGFSVVAAGVPTYAALRKTHGRPKADRLLVYALVVLGQTVRESDVVARVVPDGFALLLPGTPQEALEALLGRISTRFAHARFQVEGQVVQPSVCLGAVSFPDVLGTPVQLLEAAQLEQRRSGEGGRSRVATRISM